MSRTLEIRPSSSTRKYANAAGDAEKMVGSCKLHGRDRTFSAEEQAGHVTLEAVDVKNNKLIWTGTLRRQRKT